MAESLAVDAVKAVAQLVGAQAWEEISLAWGFQDHLEKLKDKFLDTQAFLEDVGSAMHAEKSRVVNRWLEKVKDVAYLADNIMDDYAYEILRRKLEVGKNISLKKLRNLFSCNNNTTVFRFRMTHKVLEILSKFDELDKEAHRIGLRQVKLSREAITTASYNEEYANLYQVRKHAAARAFDFVGRKDDEKKLLQMLCNTTNMEGDLSTIAIFGIGGLGKTTLARRLYEHEVIDGHFGKKKVWICVSETFDIKRLLKEMLESLTSRRIDLSNTGAIIEKLREEFKGMKFLLVLDDVWNKNQELWDSLKSELQRIGDASGSVVFITTRSIEVATKAGAIYKHKLEGLSEDDGWALLKHKVFASETLLNISEFEDIGRRIVMKCKGVPLAIKAMRGFLQSKKHPSEWDSIVTSELWDLPQDHDENSILPSLLLSYNHLPSVSVKQCFAYCAIFPKDSKLKKHVLISLWMAQGFLHESKMSNLSCTMEKVGERYFDVLLNNSFLQEEEEVDVIGEISSYKMHDLLHDLAAFISKKDLFVSKAVAELEDIFSVRHIVINSGKEEITPEIPTKVAIRNLRTISIWGGVPRWDSVISARYMRVLIMVDIGLKEIPPVIGQLIHLRYLDLSENYIKTLPESICKLYQLQTLRLLHTIILCELPKELHRLENLRHIETTDYLSPSRGLRQLTSLQTLPHLKLRDGEGWTIDELGPLHQVRGKLYINGLEVVKNKEEARKAFLCRKDGISELKLEWESFWRCIKGRDKNNLDEDVLDSLEPHPNIKSLSVSGFMGESFPSWIMTMVVKQRDVTSPLSNLARVELSDCKRCQQLPTLGQLPFLRILKLEEFESVECIGDGFYQSSTITATKLHDLGTAGVLFRALRELYVKNFESLTSWMSPSPALVATAFPSLETLEIERCPLLKMVPAFNVRSLKHLELEDLGGAQPLDLIRYSHNLNSLSVHDILELQSLPQELLNCTDLQKLHISSCENLKYLPNEMSRSLTELGIWGCPSLTCIPTSLGECTSLKSLSISDCPSIQGPLPDLSKLQGLGELDLVDSGELMTSAAKWISHLHRLWGLEIGGFKDEEEFKHFLSSMTLPLTFISNQSFTRLTLKACPNVKALPQQLQLFLTSTLRILQIWQFHDLEGLPEWIGNFSSLERLILRECKNLKFLPSKQAMLRLCKLETFMVYACPLLVERCVEDTGPEWIKISHVPMIDIYRI
ncbi:putative disease resistance protein RGA3 [Beta vulgaris subsp. vulgaris]|uniref:putative disease resistance protein RGA3 n=1 Tax=Beta vulgaris subsp. vulgaris TaxID=3555 RepID=UPI0020370E86|nr:putative disease resistance protein RGA3 [Beta vulgaris subsp. vulgaris]XP_019107731.2 putative disease resistance protein RGA3 [Beta vulgaris subsp. vulgaris]XP_019107732.2 putative disease resistance protein RGA3 [Beta vulgaris subsp. vulgaris]XP_048497468.1 putative disease resistance protein RGA3 [Beta vulgaris subsp. vulgaris]XP_048497473.1 putative disease resistance protein RGA3 [Beta vulgaris subsp. vulgaris]XP_048497480.1 putative disease resistance protein RGA3 [Beta vulgaris subs